MRGLDGNRLSEAQIDEQFARPFTQPSILVSPPGSMFKGCMEARFSGGCFTQIRKEPGTAMWGVLWLHPDHFAVTPDDLWEYFSKFGLQIIPGELKIRRIPVESWPTGES